MIDADHGRWLERWRTRFQIVMWTFLGLALLWAVGTSLVQLARSDDAPTPSSIAGAPSSTSTSTTLPPTTTSTADPTPCVVPAATMATDLGRRPSDVNGPHDCSGDWGWIDLECEVPDPEVGCLHSGNLVHRVDGRWTRVDTLLQDCAEAFLAHGAPERDALALYPRCFG